MQLNKDLNISLYRQLMSEIKYQIETGKYKNGEKNINQYFFRWSLLLNFSSSRYVSDLLGNKYLILASNRWEIQIAKTIAIKVHVNIPFCIPIREDRTKGEIKKTIIRKGEICAEI